ncbi:unnamed protein product, partial [marine sediment metagenome]
DSTSVQFQFNESTGVLSALVAVPEPSAFVLAALGLLGLLAFSWGKYHRRA